MSFKNKKTASKAGLRAGKNRTDKALSDIMRSRRAGTLTLAQSRRYAEMMNKTYGMDYTPDWLFNNQRSD